MSHLKSLAFHSIQVALLGSSLVSTGPPLPKTAREVMFGEKVDSGVQVELRGLSVVDASTAWGQRC